MPERAQRPRRPGRPGRERRDPLADALRRFVAVRREAAPRPPPEDLPGRLDRLERDVQEVRTRVNALFFAVLTAAAGDLVGRLVLG